MGDEICRICLNNIADGINLNALFDGDKKYGEIYFITTGIQIQQHEQLPSNICVACSDLLIKLYNFVQLCKINDKKLRDDYTIIKEDEIKVEDDVKQEIELVEHKYVELEPDYSPQRDDDQDSEIEIPIKPKGRKKIKRIKEEGDWKCEQCGIFTETECRLKKHYKKDHPNIPYTYPCKVCNKIFRRRNDLRVHSRVHSGERPYTCEWCGAGFSQWGTLRQHKYAHTGEKPYACSVPKCKGRFASISSLHRHEQTHGGEKRHVCELCGRKFICASALRAHHIAHSAQRPYKCSLCSRTFKSRLSQRNHQMTHGERTFVCEDCGKEFFVKGNLSKHRKKMHSEGAGTCPICHKDTSDLKEHAAVHSVDLNYKCDICKRSFRHKGILNAHLVLHKNANKYKCPNENCSKAFNRKNLMEFHYNKVHTNKTPHHCNVCQQGFYRISDLTRHVNTLHPNTK